MEETPILKVEGLKTYFPVGGGLFGKKQVVKAVNGLRQEYPGPDPGEDL